METFVVRIDEQVPGVDGYPVFLVNAANPGVKLAEATIPPTLAPTDPGNWLSRDQMLDKFKEQVSEDEAFGVMGDQLHRLIAAGSMGAALENALLNPSRILLDIRPPELQDLPWEIMQDQGFAVFTTVSNPWLRGTVPEPGAPASQRPLVELDWPLRVLVIVGSGPPDEDESGAVVRADDEVDALIDALRDVEGDVDLWVENCPSRTRIADLFGDSELQPHVLHFIGHGHVDGNVGYLDLFQEGLDSVPWSHGAIRTDFQALPRRPRLVVLNACRTGDSGSRGPLGSVAQAFLRAGVPAVISMGSDVTGQNAVEFTRQLYTALAAEKSLDAAVARARLRIYQSVKSPEMQREWALPSLFVRDTPEQIVTLRRSPPARLNIVRSAPFWTDLQLYVDRRQERCTNWRNLFRTNYQVLALVGDRKSGKSAVAQMLIERAVLAGHEARYVSFAGMDRLSVPDLLAGIVEGRPSRNMTSSLTDPLPDPAFAAFRGLIPTIPPAGVEALFSAFRAGLTAMAAQQQVTIVLDQLENMNEGDFNALVRPNLIKWWTSLQDSHLRLILVVTTEQYERLGIAASGVPSVESAAFKREQWAPLGREFIRRAMAVRNHTLTADDKEYLDNRLNDYYQKRILKANQPQWSPANFLVLSNAISELFAE